MFNLLISVRFGLIRNFCLFCWDREKDLKPYDIERSIIQSFNTDIKIYFVSSTNKCLLVNLVMQVKVNKLIVLVPRKFHN